MEIKKDQPVIKYTATCGNSVVGNSVHFGENPKNFQNRVFYTQEILNLFFLKKEKNRWLEFFFFNNRSSWMISANFPLYAQVAPWLFLAFLRSLDLSKRLAYYSKCVEKCPSFLILSRKKMTKCPNVHKMSNKMCAPNFGEFPPVRTGCNLLRPSFFSVFEVFRLV